MFATNQTNAEARIFQIEEILQGIEQLIQFIHSYLEEFKMKLQMAQGVRYAGHSTELQGYQQPAIFLEVKCYEQIHPETKKSMIEAQTSYLGRPELLFENKILDEPVPSNITYERLQEKINQAYNGAMLLHFFD